MKDEFLEKTLPKPQNLSTFLIAIFLKVILPLKYKDHLAWCWSNDLKPIETCKIFKELTFSIG